MPEFSRAIITLFHKREAAEQVSQRNAYGLCQGGADSSTTHTYRVAF